MAFESTRQEKTDALKKFVRSDAFKKQYGDWEKGQSSLVLGEDGEPLVLWHGSPNEFQAFDLSHAGENTGITEYTLKSTGEKTVSDSSKTIFFTDNRQLAASYAFLARTQELRHLTGLMTDLISCLRNPLHPFFTDYIKSKKDLVEAAQTLRRENDAELDAFLDRLPDLNRETPISSMDENSREELRNDLIQIRERYEGYYNMNRNGGISNRLNNLTRAKDYLQYFVENFDRLCGGDTSVMTVHGEDFNQYNNSFYSPEGNLGIFIFISSDRELMVSGYKDAPVLLKTLSPDQRKEILQRIEDDLNACIENYNADLERSGYRKHTHLYPVLLKAKNPLEHDYQGSSFPDKYKPNEKYSTAYVAARQCAKAIRDGYDAVVYKNITDPFLGTTYGVFSTENIVMIDRSLMREEELSPRLEVKSNINKVMEENSEMNINEPVYYIDLSYYQKDKDCIVGDMGYTLGGDMEESESMDPDVAQRNLEHIADYVRDEEMSDNETVIAEMKCRYGNGDVKTVAVRFVATENIPEIPQSVLKAYADVPDVRAVLGRADEMVKTVGFARFASTNSIELSSVNKEPVHVNGKLFRGCDYSAFWMKYKPGTKLSVNGRSYDVGGRSVEDVYQTVIKGYASKEKGKGKAPSPDSPLYGMDASDFARKGYLPLVGIYAQQYPEKLELLKERIKELSVSGPVVLTDRFWNQKTNACQAVAWAMLANGEQMDYSMVTSEGLDRAEYEKLVASGRIVVDGSVKAETQEMIVSESEGIGQGHEMNAEHGLDPDGQ